MKSTFTLLTLVLALVCLPGKGAEPPRKVTARKAIGHAELYWLLDRACWYGDPIGAKMLLDAGADPNGVGDYKAFRGRFGIEPSWPINQAAQGGHLGVVELLLQAGAKVDLVEGENYTALLLATEHHHPKVVERLLAAGADTAYSGVGGTAIEIARAKGFTDIVQMLESAKATAKPARKD